MCCFSGQVEHVANTNIFARGVNGKQILVYSMTYAAAGDLAMVLPLPVPPNPSEDAVMFINLEGYPDFFEDMSRPFAVGELFAGLDESLGVIAPTLQVHDVGSFEASFVPRVRDFERLDERFRLPNHVWDGLPAYRDYGFAVFKLKGSGPRGNGRNKVHPMAFVFPRRDPNRLFFPTVHVHDGHVHPTVRFDHRLYFQVNEPPSEFLKGIDRAHCQHSYQPASQFMDMNRTAGTVDPNQDVWSIELMWFLDNSDTLVGQHGYIPQGEPIKIDLIRVIDKIRWKDTVWCVVFSQPQEIIPCYSEAEVGLLLAQNTREAKIHRMTRDVAEVQKLTRADWLVGKR